jgi:hypothetical protein
VSRPSQTARVEAARSVVGEFVIVEWSKSRG